MKDFAERFYKSKRWQKNRDDYADSVGGLCESCAAKGLVVPGEIVHHRVELTPENIQDPAITMGYTVSYKHHRQGYAYEMLSAVIAQLHGCYPDREFICMVEPENVASMGLLKKLGFDHICYAPEVTSEVFGKWTIPKE